jgi:hypothetical protein
MRVDAVTAAAPDSGRFGGRYTCRGGGGSPNDICRRYYVTVVLISIKQKTVCSIRIRKSNF